MTIRASQVLPVYPLTEDLQPGDVFLVQTPLADQVRIYEKKGFLPLDQLATRLEPIPYRKFYESAYLNGTYANVPHGRPKWDSDSVVMPRVAFPTYTFSVRRGAGLKLAIPISGVPVGLGIMGAKRATGSVTIADAYTYGVDAEALVRALAGWWGRDTMRRETLAAVVRESGPVYLRVVTRVFLTGKVTVSLTNQDSLGVGVDAGDAPALALMELSTDEPSKVSASATAYREALDALSEPLNGATPGAGFRFSQASQRSVSMDETFDRPLVIGYLGYDVRVFEDGSLSAPIPSFATVNDHSDALNKVQPFEFSPDANTALLETFADIDPDALQAWLGAQGQSIALSDLFYAAEHACLRGEAVKQFDLE